MKLFLLVPLVTCAVFAEEPQMAVTHHQIRADGQVFGYTARAGSIDGRTGHGGRSNASESNGAGVD